MSAARFRFAVATAAVVSIGFAGGLATAGPTTEPAMIDNPLYLAWAKHRPGTSVVFAEGFVTAGDRSPETFDERTTLVAVDRDAVTLRKPGFYDAERTFAKTSAGGLRRTGTGDVVAMGRTFRCDVFEVPGDGGGTLYVNGDVPGGIVKFDVVSGCCGRTAHYVGVVSSFAIVDTATTRPATGPVSRPATTRAAGVRPYTAASWADFKPGSSQTLRCGDDAKSYYELTSTLTAVATDGVELGVAMRRFEDGKEQPNGDPSPERLPAGVNEAAYPFKRTGTRDVAAAGRTFHCDVYEGKGEWGPCDNDAAFVICTSGDVPGGVVEMTVAFDADPEHRHDYRLAAYTVK